MPSEMMVKTFIEEGVIVMFGTQKKRQHCLCFTGLNPSSHSSHLAAEKLLFNWLLALFCWIFTKHKTC